MNWVGEFFRTLPEVGSQLWEFANSGGVMAIPVTIGTFLLLGLCAAAAHKLREEHGWLSAILGAMAATIAMYWGFGVIPSAWVYFLDSSKDVLQGKIIPESLPLMTNFYQVFRDSVVVGMTVVATVGLAAIAGQVQKRYPRGLAEGEEARPQSGGYK